MVHFAHSSYYNNMCVQKIAILFLKLYCNYTTSTWQLVNLRNYSAINNVMFQKTVTAFSTIIALFHTKITIKFWNSNGGSSKLPQLFFWATLISSTNLRAAAWPSACLCLEICSSFSISSLSLASLFSRISSRLFSSAFCSSIFRREIRSLNYIIQKNKLWAKKWMERILLLMHNMKQRLKWCRIYVICKLG